jgi:hypothetical protein
MSGERGLPMDASDTVASHLDIRIAMAKRQKDK